MGPGSSLLSAVQVVGWDGVGDLPPAAATARFWVPPGYAASSRLEQVLAALPELAVIQLLTVGADSYLGRYRRVCCCAMPGAYTAARSWTLPTRSHCPPTIYCGR